MGPPGSVFTAPGAIPDAVAVVGYNKILTVYRFTGEGLEFKTAIALP